ncbi:mitochondrial carrier domain-containing protein [Lentinula detonsa]|uniref:Mitochondrial carrier domain-containing protein n=1 Tax=Lentinula detonsa TaxID=2804962 RepID=A0AA38PRA0_9AGAR|nr:mitochondrial carrier domain-containing protein [Lentinula detonsa]
MGPSSGGNANANVNVCADVLRIGAAIERRLYERVRTVADVNVGGDDGAVAGLMLPVCSRSSQRHKHQVSLATLNPILFQDHATASLGKKFFLLFPGLGYAAGYKVAQRVYKFLTGIGEVVLLPLDALKIKRQVNPDAFRGRGIIRIIAEEKSALYRGWGWTMARNAPGNFALFGASAVTKDYILGVTDYSKATWTQNFIASIAGAVTPITVAAPLDTVKTRIQNANFESKVNGAVVIKDLIKNEGITAFFKGLTPKIIVVGPKLVFSYTLAQSLIPLFGQYV